MKELELEGCLGRMATPDDRVKELESHAAALSTQLEASKSREAALAKELSAANLKLKLADESGKESERRLASQVAPAGSSHSDLQNFPPAEQPGRCDSSGCSPTAIIRILR